jgi:hypothetical protein
MEHSSRYPLCNEARWYLVLLTINTAGRFACEPVRLRYFRKTKKVSALNLSFSRLYTNFPSLNRTASLNSNNLQKAFSFRVLMDKKSDQPGEKNSPCIHSGSKIIDEVI